MNSVKKIYNKNSDRNSDICKLLNEGYVITRIYGDGKETPLTVEYINSK